MAMLAPLIRSGCYAPKFYKAPSDDGELLDPFAFVKYGLQITPGSLLYGFYLPMRAQVATPTDWSNPLLFSPGQFTVTIKDVSMQHDFWDDPIGSCFLANFKPTFQADDTYNMGSFPNLLTCPHPIVGSGLLDVGLQNTAASINPDTLIVTGLQQRVQLVMGVLEVCSATE
jgi:hypothetical protein